MAVVAALIAGISLTFIVEIDFDFGGSFGEGSTASSSTGSGYDPKSARGKLDVGRGGEAQVALNAGQISEIQSAVLQVVVVGSMVVCFLALYATMVLSSQYVPSLPLNPTNIPLLIAID
jgi:hypothetical protein